MIRWIQLSLMTMCVIAMVISCSEENITYITEKGGVIYGHVISTETGIVVEIWQAALVKSVVADEEGYFSVSELAPGVYEVRIKAPSGRKKVIQNINVDNERASRLDVIDLSDLVWPLVYYWPNDEEIDVSLLSRRVNISSEVALNLASLNNVAHFAPAIDGHWEEGSSYSGFEYQFVPSLLFKSGTTYTLSVGSDLLLLSGEEMGGTFSFSFTTLEFSVSQKTFPSSQWGIPPSSYDLVNISFSAPIDPATAGSFITIEPPLQLIVTASRHYSDSLLSMYLEISRASSLQVGTTYTLTLASGLSAKDGSTLGQQEIIQFAVQPLAVTLFRLGDYYNQFGDSLIEPGLEFYCAMSFNAEVDLDSLNSAVTITPPIEGFWYRQSGDWTPVSGSYQFFATGTEQLQPDQKFILTISGDVGLANGGGFGGDWVREFRTRPVMVTSMSPQRGSRGVRYTDLSASFNVLMDHVATEAAFHVATLSGTPVSGTFTWDRYNSIGERLLFRPSAQLTVGEIYTITVTTSARSASGVNLKEEGYTFFEAGG